VSGSRKNIENLDIFHYFLTFQWSRHADSWSFRNTTEKNLTVFRKNEIFPEIAQNFVESFAFRNGDPEQVLALSVHYLDPTHVRTGEAALRYPSDLSDRQCV
jgi:hypothetical protein